MPMKSNYQETVTTYTAQLRNLLAASPRSSISSTGLRGPVPPVTDALADRAERLVATSWRLGKMTADYLQTGDPAQQEAAEMKLLAQATAEIQAAHVLLEAISLEAQEGTADRTSRRSAIVEQQRTLRELIEILEAPIEAGMQPYLARSVLRNATVHADDRIQARFKLQMATQESLRTITEEASECGGQALRVLVLMDAAALLEGVRLVDREMAEHIERAVGRLGGTVRRLALAALRLLVQACNQVRGLMGHGFQEDIEGALRSWFAGFLEGLEEEQEEGVGLFGRLVLRIYQPGTISVEVADWLTRTQVDPEALNRTATTVTELAEKYRTKAGRVVNLVRAVALVRRLPPVATPPGQALAAATILSLLGYTLCAGYDYVGADRFEFARHLGFSLPGRVLGVRKTIYRALEIEGYPAAPSLDSAITGREKENVEPL